MFIYDDATCTFTAGEICGIGYRWDGLGWTGKAGLPGTFHVYCSKIIYYYYNIFLIKY